MRFASSCNQMPILMLGMIRVEAFHLYSSKLTPAGPIHTRELTIPARSRESLTATTAVNG